MVVPCRDDGGERLGVGGSRLRMRQVFRSRGPRLGRPGVVNREGTLVFLSRTSWAPLA